VARLAVALTSALAVAVPAALILRSNPPSAPPTSSVPSAPTLTFHVVDDESGGFGFPGGALKLDPAHGGGWLLVYQRSVAGVPAVFAREAGSLHGPFGTPMLVSNPLSSSAFDPGAISLPGGSVIVTWAGRNAFWYAERLAEGRYGPTRELFSEPGAVINEQTVGRIAGRTFIVYDHRLPGPVKSGWDVRLRFLSAGPSVGSPIRVADQAVGAGAQGNQRRITVTPTGEGEELLAVWNQRVAGDARLIYAARSADGGWTWAPPFPLASFPSRDLVNPFALLISAQDLRVYFSQDRHNPSLGYVRSIDHGRTWGPRTDVETVPAEASSARIVIAVDGRDVIAFATTRGFGPLGTFVVARLHREGSTPAGS
jgi:hypothetical protein